MNDPLTPEALRKWSGLQRPSAVRRWLDRLHIPYLPGADGWPKVAPEAMMYRIGAPVAVPSHEPRLKLRNG